MERVRKTSVVFSPGGVSDRRFSVLDWRKSVTGEVLSCGPGLQSQGRCSR